MSDGWMMAIVGAVFLLLSPFVAWLVVLCVVAHEMRKPRPGEWTEYPETSYKPTGPTLGERQALAERDSYADDESFGDPFAVP